MAIAAAALATGLLLGAVGAIVAGDPAFPWGMHSRGSQVCDLAHMNAAHVEQMMSGMMGSGMGSGLHQQHHGAWP